MFTLFGLPYATLFGLGGAALALAVALYILKLKRRPVPVPFSPIWRRILRDSEATHWFARLKRLLSLLLQLALLTLIIAALGDPRLAAGVARGRNIVVLVDASASMKARDVAPSRIEAAQTEVRKLVTGLSGADRMLVAQMDATLTPLSTLTGELAELNLAVDQLAASDTRADFERGLRFAVDTLSGLPQPEIIVVSDGGLGDTPSIASRLPLGDVALSYLPIGKSARNVAITAFSVRRYPLDKSRYEVLLELLNTTDERLEVELTLLGDGAVVDVSKLALGPGERLPRFYQDLAGASRTLEATIALTSGAADDLPADDHAYALMPERRRVRVLVVSPGNTYLEAALLLDEYLDVKQITPGEYPVPEAFDVTILDGVAPEPMLAEHGSLLYLNPPAEGSPVAHKKKIEDFGFDLWERKSPLLRWMAMDNIQVTRGVALEPQKGDLVVGKSDLGAILVQGRRDVGGGSGAAIHGASQGNGVSGGGRSFVALGFDPRNSDFVLRVAWPLFVLNVINAFVEEETGYISSYRTGEVWRLKVPADARAVHLTTPGGVEHTLPAKAGRAAFFGTQAGLYELKTNADSDAATGFAANLSDPTESQIKPVPVLQFGERRGGAVAGFNAGVRNEIWLYLIAAALVLSVLEWFAYHRRVTV